MTLRCAICGRKTEHPAVWVGREPIGPVCARKTGLYKASKKLKASKVSTQARKRRSGVRSGLADGFTIDMFEEAL